MYKITSKFLDIETIKQNNKLNNDIISNETETYLSLKNKYESKSVFILNKLDNEIQLLSEEYNTLRTKLELEHNIIKRFLYKLQNITILMNDNIKMNCDDDDKPPYLFLNEIYIIDENLNKNKIIKTIVNTLYDNKHLKFETPYLYENTITYTEYNLYNDYEFEYNMRDNNPICSLFLLDNINKIKLDYKNFYLKELEKMNNKNKTFNKQLKATKSNISILEKENKTHIKNIKEIRNRKIESYKDLNKTVYNSYLTILFNNKSNIGSINEFFFFDTKEIYSLIGLIKDNKIKIANYKLDVKNIEYIKNKYNSQKICNIHSSIKTHHNKASYGDVNYKSNDTITKYELFDMIKNYDNSINNNYPIIIKDLESFRVFENKTIEIFSNFIKKQIKIGKENINDIEQEKTYIKNKLDYFLNKKANINKNVELYNNYKYYKTKLDKLEKQIFKKINQMI